MWDSISISSNISMTNRAPTLLLFEHDLFSGRILNTKKRYHFLYLSARLICSHKTDGAVLVIFFICDSLWRRSHSASWTSSFHEVYKRELCYLKTFLCLPQGWHCGKSFTPGRGRGKGPSPRGFASHLFGSLFSLFLSYSRCLFQEDHGYRHCDS